MKTKLILPLSFLITVLCMAFTTGPGTETDYTDCMKKVGSGEWGEKCPDCKVYKDSYRVKYKNECAESLDVMICVQEKDKTWKKFMFHSIAPNDTMVVYACEGTGKVKKWAKKSGDNSIAFPTIDEVNKEYKE
jgi:hypothetical protein